MYDRRCYLIHDELRLLAVQVPAEQQTHAMACLYVWLRYSAARQLTWQRNYNTQPRILGAAQERLTAAIAKARSPLHLPQPQAVSRCLVGSERQYSKYICASEML